MNTFAFRFAVVLLITSLCAGCESMTCCGGKSAVGSQPYTNFRTDEELADSGFVWALNW